ncbi:inovirus-type Gp2 protein [Vibrio sp. TBV020]|uniref:YagK/YfjJ domain-containing protein n=1 Tax=Vibrio sp. TBV020 TaxID=3137398 RepID=UPI0038CD5416
MNRRKHLLTPHTQDSFKGLPVVETMHSLATENLSIIKQSMDHALHRHPNLLVVPVRLTIPINCKKNIEQCFNSLAVRIHSATHNKFGGFRPFCKVQIIYAKKLTDTRPIYRAVFLLNLETFKPSDFAWIKQIIGLCWQKITWCPSSAIGAFVKVDQQQVKVLKAGEENYRERIEELFMFLSIMAEMPTLGPMKSEHKVGIKQGWLASKKQLA